MLLSLVYFVLRSLLSALAPSDRSDLEREAELLVLRHQLKVLSRGVRRSPFRRRDRALPAAASRILPRERWNVFIVTPRTVLRWHRELVRRKWTYRRGWPGRPAVARRRSGLRRPARRASSALHPRPFNSSWRERAGGWSTAWAMRKPTELLCVGVEPQQACREVRMREGTRTPTASRPPDPKVPGRARNRVGDPQGPLLDEPLWVGWRLRTLESLIPIIPVKLHSWSTGSPRESRLVGVRWVATSHHYAPHRIEPALNVVVHVLAAHDSSPPWDRH